MRATDLNIKGIKTIEEIYTLIDENAFSLKQVWDVRDIWGNFRHQTTSRIAKRKARWEITCAIFEVKREGVFSQVYSKNDTAEKLENNPELAKFDYKLTDYVKIRAAEAKNPIIKARYNHLLWRSPNNVKRNTYAVTAVENYFIAIQHYIDSFSDNKYKEIESSIIELYERATMLCSEVKEGIAHLKQITQTLLFQVNDLKFWVKRKILETMLEYPKVFKADDFKDTLAVFEQKLSKTTEVSDFFLLVNYDLPVAIKIAQKTLSDVRKWYNEVGFAYLRMAEGESKDDRFWIKQNYYVKAIEAFKKASNITKVSEVEQLYSILKPQVKLSKVRHTPDEKHQRVYREFHSFIKKQSAKILQDSPSEIYAIIAGGFLFPKKDIVSNTSKDEKDDFLNHAVQIRFDSNQNIVNHRPEFDGLQDLYTSYSTYLNLSVLQYLHFILIEGIKSEHLNFENFIGFLSEKTWIGKYDLIKNEDGDIPPMNLLALITPAIVEFFMQVKASNTVEGYEPSFVLCVDSLTLKMEGLFRAFCGINNISTSLMKAKGMQEALIHEILEFEDLKKYFNEDDFLLFNYLFLNEGGMNLRNNVAHCFYDFKDYHQGQMLLLIAALLRVAKFDYVSKS